ncbi:hypothetical protein EJP82_26080 [Paenibacillus anaericanus]|uniref:Uncharacterized protein n=1 Tax=Paenibacillus anaericanus TaxID=170367 RepID=A0A3S1BFB3_9BACL|nr:hypothetical protein [Paenibacillus anaericanus]RUT39502.1 hypothetical protein EJP82_26080 [Paenibacillus anaericanus]
MGTWLVGNTQPSKKYYVETENGRRGEAEGISGIFNLIIDPGYSETEDISTKALMWILILRQNAISLAQFGQRADVYDGLGKVFSNYEQEGDLEFGDEMPLLLDAWSEETTIASLLFTGFIQLYVKDNSLQGYELLSPEKMEGAYPTDFKPPHQREN